MGKRKQNRRLLVMALLLGGAFALLGVRLVDLQVLRHGELHARARENTQREIFLEPRRGDILDARGNLLATSVFVKTVFADPTFIGNRQADIARVLAPLLQTNAAALERLLMPRVRLGTNGEQVAVRYVVLKRRVPLETWDKIQAAMTNLSFGYEEKKLPRDLRAFYRNLRKKAIGADTVDDQMRVYPNQQLAAHVLGFATSEERGAAERKYYELRGREGIELTLNAKLSGVRGWRLTETDRRNREQYAFREQDVLPRDGHDAVLTIDSVVQGIVEAALAEAMETHAPISASAIVVRPRTGEVLAMATLPNFNPNNPGDALADLRRNRVISDPSEPGSTFKIVVVSSALDDGIVTLKDTFFCENGRFPFAGRVLHDHGSHGFLTVEGIITKSSNIGAAKVGIRLGPAQLYEHMRQFGFGTRTGLPLMGESAGILHPVTNWSKVTIAQIPMGHGVSVTPLQMVMAMCAIANDGILMRPMLVDRLEDQAGHVLAKYSPQRVRLAVSAEAAHGMVRALKTVVSEEGTAPKAALPNYTVAGKTGTAQKPGGGGYLPGKYFSSFIGFFPADDPQLCISVVLDAPRQGYFGGQTAAPIFRQIAERAANYLNIRPDRDPDAADPGAALARATTNAAAIRTAANR